MRVVHGTSEAHAATIQRWGFRTGTYFADDPDARYCLSSIYAAKRAIEMGGRPILLIAEIPAEKLHLSHESLGWAEQKWRRDHRLAPLVELVIYEPMAPSVIVEVRDDSARMREMVLYGDKDGDLRRFGRTRREVLAALAA